MLITRFLLRKLMLAASVVILSNCSTITATATQREAPAGVELAVENGKLDVAGLRTPLGQLVLPYVRYHYPGRLRPTVFLLGGGPGVSNIKNKPPEQWLKDFDVVVLEYRGVGRSSIVLKTPHFARGLLRHGEGTPDKQAAALDRAYRDAFADLARQGVDFTEFSVDAVADDIERLRAQLKLEQIYLVAHSFGTRVALSYQTRYRQRVAASILFALNTPGGFLWHPEETQQVWTRYRDALTSSRREQGDRLDQMLNTRSERPGKYGFLPLNDDKALTVAFFLSFNSGTRDSALDAMAAARTGSSAAWYMYALSYNMLIRFGFNWADFYLKAYTSDCDRAAIERVGVQGSKALFQSPSSMLFAGADAFEAAGGRCQPTQLVPDYRNTLAIVGEFDPSTPIERKPDGLPSERFIVVKGAGHADVLSNRDVTANWLRQFFLHPDQAHAPIASATRQSASQE
jgi:pimeloyl-ACP methyl ester carboxylesterase